MVNREKYLIRAFHYFVRLFVLVGAAIFIIYLLGLLDTAGEPAYKVFLSSKGGLLLAALLVLAALYPKFGFGTAEVAGDMNENREQVVKAFEDYGYMLTQEDKDKMIFRAVSGRKRFFMQYDDAVTVTQIEQDIALEGHRKHIGRVQMRLEIFIERSQSN